MATRFRTDQVGSLIRPAELLQARTDHAEGRLPLDGLREAEDRAILQVLELQRQAGIDVYSDGEYRRFSWLTNMHEAIEGFVSQNIKIEWRGPGGGISEVSAQVVGSKLRQRGRIHAHEAAFMKQHSPGPFKQTIPSPMMYTHLSYKAGLTDRFYPTRADLAREILGIVSSEVRALVDEGVPYIQIDNASYAFYIDVKQREQLRQDGMDPEAMLDLAIATDNACLEAARREGVTRAFHMCRGNNRGRWAAEGGYDPIAEKLFSSLQADRFLLEYDTERAGGFEPLRFVPRGRTVALGLISTKEKALESQDLLLRRIDEASKYMPIENLALCPQCGFSTISSGHPLTWDDQRRKLDLLVDTARKVWG